MPSRLGDRLRDLREAQGLSVEDLANAAGIDESTMQAILGGDITRPPNERLRGLAELLGVSFDELLDLVPEDRRDEDAAAGAVIALTRADTDPEPPEWVQLIPNGRIETRPHDGREAWRISDIDAVVSATRDIGLPLAIDYEHQSLRSAENGQPAPAAGWITEVEARSDGIYGRVEWTDRAAAHIRAREYRFLSPTFSFDPSTREVRRIIGAGITNDPALAEIKAIAKREGTMKNLFEKLRDLLGLDKDADETAIASAVGDLVEKAKGADEATAAAKAGTETLAGIAKALGLKADATANDVETAAAKATSAAASAGDVGELRAELDQLKKERVEDKAAARVDAAISGGKLAPAQRDWALGYATSQPDEFDKFVEAQPAILKPGGGGAPSGGPSKKGSDLTEDERAFCKVRGLSEDEFKAARDAEEEEEEAA